MSEPASTRPDPHGPGQPMGCGPRIALVVIVFFVNIAPLQQGVVHLWRIAPLLDVVAAVVDVFVLIYLAISLWRRIRGPISD